MKTHRNWGPWILLSSLLAGALSCGGSTTPGGSDGGSGLTINGCTSTSYMDLSGAGATRTITFGGQGTSPAFGYAPQCMTIAAGQSVTFSGTFVAHPLSGGSSPTNLTSGSANNPIPQTSTGSSVTVTFPTAGTYTYFCQNHYAAGMTGAIQVR